MARQGGWRPRKWIVPGEVPVWVSSGRWGPRRARVSQCWTMFRAEVVYTQLLQSGIKIEPGWRAMLHATVGGQTWPVDVEVCANAVWRCGRVFFRCAACRRRATRQR